MVFQVLEWRGGGGVHAVRGQHWGTNLPTSWPAWYLSQ
jgi:hypothetical protein